MNPMTSEPKLILTYTQPMKPTLDNIRIALNLPATYRLASTVKPPRWNFDEGRWTLFTVYSLVSATPGTVPVYAVHDAEHNRIAELTPGEYRDHVLATLPPRDPRRPYLAPDEAAAEVREALQRVRSRWDEETDDLTRNAADVVTAAESLLKAAEDFQDSIRREPIRL